MYDSLSTHQQIKVIFKHEVWSVSILMGCQEPCFLPLLDLVSEFSVLYSFFAWTYVVS